MWVRGITETLFQRTLFEAIRSQRPDVVSGITNIKEAMRVIRKWLEGNQDWLMMVEDVPSSACWLDILRTKTGRVLLTSQWPHDQSRDVTKAIRLNPMSADGNLYMLRRRGAFQKINVHEVFGADVADNGNAVIKLCTEHGIPHPVALHSMRKEDVRERRRLLQKVHAEQQLCDPALKIFFSEKLENVTLFVSVFSHMATENTATQAVHDLIANFENMMCTCTEKPMDAVMQNC